MNKFGFLIPSFGIFLLASAPGAAQVPEAFLACADESNDLHRLVCYDEAMRAALAESSQQPAAAPDSASASAPVGGAVAVEAAPAVNAEPRPETAAERAAPAAAPAAATVSATSEPPDEQSFLVREVFQQPRGENGVILENGEVWQEPTASRYFPVEAGDRVTLKKRMFGGYRLITESGKAFSVSKVR